MKLFEVTTGRTGESYERFYVWCDGNKVEETVEAKYTEMELGDRWGYRALFDAADPVFVTPMSTEGFEKPE